MSPRVRVYTEAQKVDRKRKRAENKEGNKKATQKWNAANPDKVKKGTEASHRSRSQVQQVARIANGAVNPRRGKGYKPEYYCQEYKDAIDVRNAALVVALREARAIKCEKLRQKALRHIRRRKREVPDTPAAMWKNAKTGTGTFALEIRLAVQEENPLADASVLENTIQTFLSRI